MKKRLFSILLASICVAQLIGCGSDFESSRDYDTEEAMSDSFSGMVSGVDYEYSEAPTVDYDSEVAINGQQAQSQRKLITTMNISAETNEFDEMLVNVEKRAEELGGYIESSNLSTRTKGSRSANYTIRIPEANLSSFTDLVDDQGNITYTSKNVSDVTLSYVDIESRKEVYETEIDTLTNMLAEAEDIDTMLAIETRLSEVTAQVESMEAQLRAYDNQCSFSTIYLDISEVEVFTVVETKEQTAMEKMSQGFMHSLESVGKGLVNFAIGFVIILPQLFVVGAIIFIIVFIIKSIIKSGEKKETKRRAEYEARMMDDSKE